MLTVEPFSPAETVIFWENLAFMVGSWLIARIRIPGFLGGHVGKCIGVGLRTIRIKERRLVNKQHSKLDAGAAGFYVREAQRDRKSDFHLLAAAVGEIRAVRSGDTGNPDLQAVHDLFRASLLLLRADVYGHTAAGHGCEDVVAAVHNFGDDTTNNHVLDAVKAKGGGQCGVVVQHLRRRCDVLPQLCRLCFGFRDAFQLRLDGAALGRQVIDGRPVGVSDRLEAGELIVLGGEPRQKVGRAARGFGPLRRKVGRCRARALPSVLQAP